MSLGIEDLHKALHELFVPEFFSATAVNASRSVSSSRVAPVGVSVSRTQKSGSRSRDLQPSLGLDLIDPRSSWTYWQVRLRDTLVQIYKRLSFSILADTRSQYLALIQLFGWNYCDYRCIACFQIL